MSVQISTHIDEVTKQQFDKVCGAIGISPSDVIDLFIRDVVSYRGIPYNVADTQRETKVSKMSREATFGCMRGQFTMADDFDVPMELRESAEPVKRVPKLGGWEGKIWMADDFDAPMEEFAEYM